MPKVEINVDKSRVWPPKEIFLLACPDRIKVTDIVGAKEIKNDDGNTAYIDVNGLRIRNPDSYVCKAISEKCGDIFSIQPRDCAKCQISGSVNPQYIKNISVNRIGRVMAYLRLGFYDVETTKQILLRAYSQFKDSFKERMQMRSIIHEMVRTNKLDLEDTKAFVLDKMPILESTAEEDDKRVSKNKETPEAKP